MLSTTAYQVGVPGHIAPAILGHTTPLVNLKLIIGLIVAVEVDENAKAIMTPQIGITLPFLTSGTCLPLRMSAANANVQIFAVVGKESLRAVFFIKIARQVIDGEGFGTLPTGVVQFAIQVRFGFGFSAMSQWLRWIHTNDAIGQPDFGSHRITPRVRTLGQGLAPMRDCCFQHVAGVPFLGRFHIT